MYSTVVLTSELIIDEFMDVVAARTSSTIVDYVLTD